MITGNIYKQGEEVYVIWNFTSIDEQKALRRLLKDTDTRIGYRVTHFVTKVQPLAGQMTIDCFGVQIPSPASIYTNKDLNNEGHFIFHMEE